MLIHKNIVQGSDEWRAIRKGKMTASHAQEIGNNGKGLNTYIIKLMAEYYSSGEHEGYRNAHMERGNELEPIARSMYELETGMTVEQVGFVEHNEFAGCSPDGLVGEDGGVEIKCHDDVTHFRFIMNGESEIDTKYIWQIQMNLMITGRDWWDYIAYNPNFEQSLLVFRIYPDPEAFKKLEAGLETGEKQIKSIFLKLKK